MPKPTTSPDAFGFPWTPDDRSGGYVNPVLFADYSDPDVVRVGDDFWLTASSFNCTPGLPILHSRDLVNWTIVGHAVANVPGSKYDAVLPGCGVWAPSIRFHAGQFWIFFPTPDEGIYQTTAVDPRGPWTKPLLVLAGRGLIDPCPLWDDDGRAYLVHAYAGSRAGIKDRLDVREMAPDGTRLIGPPHTILHDPEHQPTSEGPKFYKRNGFYYVWSPAGGVGTGWQLVLRSRNVFGPYEGRIVLAQGQTTVNGPHQGALVDTAGGESWFIHFQEWQPYGRIVHLQPVAWVDDWPVIGEPSDQPGVGQPVRRHRKPAVVPGAIVAMPATTDLFDGPALGLQWQWHANHRDDWHSLSARPGWLRLRGMPVDPKTLSLTPHLLLQKLPAYSFRFETTVQVSDLDAAGGVAVVGLATASSAALSLRRRRAHDAAEVVLRIGTDEVYSAPVPGDTVDLRVRLHPGGACEFAYRQAHAWVPLQQTFQAREGRWIGAKIGIFADGDGSVHCDFGPARFGPVE